MHEFAPRAIESINGELSRRYGAEIDATSRLAGLELVASCLKSGDLPRAQIGALMVRFPDPPQVLAKGQQDIQHWSRLEGMLDLAGLLKAGVWDPSKHLRLGAPPNRGWFAPKDPVSRWLRQTSGWLVRSVEVGASFGRVALAMTLKANEVTALGEYGLTFFQDPDLMPSTGDPTADNYGAAKDPPKTLEELQKPPTHYQMGYERHHIEEQNPANIAKRLAQLRLSIHKFGRAMIDDESNLVWVPRYKHRDITAKYNSKIEDRLHRLNVNELDFAAQREEGLATLREVGVLK